MLPQDASDGKTGAISAWALADGKSVDDCITLSKTMAQDAFQQREVSRYPLGWTLVGQRFWRCVLTLLLDSKYDPGHLERWLKAEFGASRTLSDWSPASAKGMLVGMPVTTVEDTATFVATNQCGALDPNGIAGTSDVLGRGNR